MSVTAAPGFRSPKNMQVVFTSHILDIIELSSKAGCLLRATQRYSRPLLAPNLRRERKATSIHIGTLASLFFTISTCCSTWQHNSGPNSSSDYNRTDWPGAEPGSPYFHHESKNSSTLAPLG
jgi:hypothetical protein